MASDTFNLTSLSLLQRARSNDQDAWSELVQLYGPLVHRWCRRSGLNEDDTADVFQETFRSVAMRLESFTPRQSVGSFRSWLRTVVRTKVADHYRSRQRQPPGRGGSEAQTMISSVADPLAEESEDEAAEENALVVQRAMEMIRPEFSSQNWKAFEQVALERQSAVEVAERLGVSPQTIRQANYRIRRRLRLLLEDVSD